jgi:hypothetical protein
VIAGAKARAMLRGSSAASLDDVFEVARDALPHRIVGDADPHEVTDRAIEETRRAFQ